MADGNDTIGKAWGSKEIKRFIKTLGLPTTGQAMSYGFAVDFEMRRGNRVAAAAAARNLAGLDPNVDADTMVDLALRAYEDMDRAFRNGELDDLPDVPDDEEEGELDTDYSDELYRGMLRVLGAPTTDVFVDMARQMTRAREAGDDFKAKYWAKSIVKMIETSGGSSLLDPNDPTELTLNMDLDMDEQVKRIFGASEYITDDFVNNNPGGDIGNYDQDFHDVRDDPRYDQTDTTMDMTLKEQEDAEAAAKVKADADALRDKALQKLGIPSKFKSDIQDLIRYAVEHRFKRLRDRATAIATAIATDEANGGEVDEGRITALISELTNAALAAADDWNAIYNPDQQHRAPGDQDGQPGGAPAGTPPATPKQPKGKAGKAKPDRLAQDMQLTIDKMIEFLKTGDKREAMELALDQARDMRKAGLSSKPAEEIAKKIMKSAMEKHAKQQRREEMLKEAEVERQRQIDAENVRAQQDDDPAPATQTAPPPTPPRPDLKSGDLKETMKKMIEALKSGDRKLAMAFALQQAQAMRAAGLTSKSAEEVAKSLFAKAQAKAAEHIRRAEMFAEAEVERQRQEDVRAAAEYAARGSTNTLARVAEELRREDEDGEQEGPDGMMPDTGVEVTVRHASSTDWIRVSTLYGFDPDEVEALESLGTQLAKKGPEDGTAKRLAKGLHERGKKKKKKPRVKNYQHILAAVLDAIRRKANKKKVSKPLKPGDIQDQDDDQSKAA